MNRRQLLIYAVAASVAPVTVRGEASTDGVEFTEANLERMLREVKAQTIDKGIALRARSHPCVLRVTRQLLEDLAFDLPVGVIPSRMDVVAACWGYEGRNLDARRAALDEVRSLYRHPALTERWDAVTDVLHIIIEEYEDAMRRLASFGSRYSPAPSYPTM